LHLHMETLTQENIDNLLEIKGLSVSVVNNKLIKPLVQDINFSIERGSFTALVGKSGYGKSITIKSVLGFLSGSSWKLEGLIDFILKEEIENTEGEKVIGKRVMSILNSGIYNNENVSSIIGKQIVTVFQGPDTHLNPSLKIGWQIGEMIKAKNPLLEEEEILRRLTRVKLSIEAIDKYPFQLSQGQKQRVMISFALGGAELVIADEPTSSLDIGIKSNIIDLLKDLREQSMINTMLIITHDLYTLKQLLRPTDPVYVMDYNTNGISSIVDHCLMKDVIKAKKSIHPLLKPLEIPIPEKQNLNYPSPLMVKIEDLRQGYKQGLFKKDIEVLKGINLDISRGEIVGIVGESACGKTTLLRSILRLLNNTEGRITFRNEGIHEDKDLIKIQPKGLRADTKEMHDLRKKIQVIFQNSASTFNQRMMIHEILSETIKLSGISNEETIFNIIVNKLIEFKLCNSEENAIQILTKFPNELSGGEKQRLAILRAFLLEPEILLADEPLAEQDVITKGEIIEMFHTINNNGCTILIISHDINLIKGLCSRILYMREGMLFNDNLN
jgi:peptide/nickel transport system ATP-binding protein